MKKYINSFLFILIIFTLLLSLSSCGDKYRKKINEEYYEFKAIIEEPNVIRKSGWVYYTAVGSNYFDFSSKSLFELTTDNIDLGYTIKALDTYDHITTVYIDNDYYKYIYDIDDGEWFYYKALQNKKTHQSDVEGIYYKITFYNGDIPDGLDTKEYVLTYDLNELIPFKRDGKTLIAVYYSKKAELEKPYHYKKQISLLFMSDLIQVKKFGKIYYKISNVRYSDMNKAFVIDFDESKQNTYLYENMFYKWNYLVYTFDDKEFIAYRGYKEEFLELKEKYNLKKRDYFFYSQYSSRSIKRPKDYGVFDLLGDEETYYYDLHTDISTKESEYRKYYYNFIIFVDLEKIMNIYYMTKIIL